MSAAEVDVPDDNAVWLAVSAGNYHDADLAFWKVKQELAGRELSPAGQAHLDQLRQRRKDCYADLVIWVMTVEAERQGVQRRPEVTPVTSPAADARAALDGCTGAVDCPSSTHVHACQARSRRPAQNLLPGADGNYL